MLESEIGRQKDEIASLKQQLADSQSIERERKKLADKVEKLESKVSFKDRFRNPRNWRIDHNDSLIQMEDMIQDKVGAKEAELHAAYDERLRNYDER